MDSTLFSFPLIGFIGLIMGCETSQPDKQDDVAPIDQDQDGYFQEDDCNDLDASVSPGSVEVCNGYDDNCDGLIDTDDPNLDASSLKDVYLDSDGDGFGDNANKESFCLIPDGFVENNEDCDDTNAAVFPTAIEICNGFDDNCDQVIDTDAVDADAWYLDSDLDGYGAVSTLLMSCVHPTGYVADNTDCDDANDLIFPNNDEVCNGYDDNCDELVDELDPNVDLSTGAYYYLDADNDGFGDSEEYVLACQLPTGYTDNSLDCDDGDGSINPDSVEVCDGVDNDCNTLTSEQQMVSQLDGVGTVTDVSVNFSPPAVYELPDQHSLLFCSGDYDVSLTVNGVADVIGVGTDVLLSSSSGSIIASSAADLYIDNLTLADSQGAIEILSSNVLIEDSHFNNNWGNGAIVSTDGQLTISNVTFDSNSSTGNGGAISAENSIVEVQNSSFVDNVATANGGGVYLENATLNISESYMMGNVAQQGGAVWADSSTVECSGTTSSTHGFESNIAQDAGIVLRNGTVLTSNDCDYGADASEDNQTVDIALDSGFNYFAPDDASFQCSGGVCGSSIAYPVGLISVDTYSNNNAFRGNVYTVSGHPTLDRFEMEMTYDFCTFNFFVFDRETELHPWELLWSESKQAINTTGWATSGVIGIPLETGHQILLGVGWNCNSAPDYFSYSSDLMTDYGIGSWAGYRAFESNYDANNFDSFHPSSTVGANYLYHQRVFSTDL